MAMKIILQFLVLALVFNMLTTHRAWAEDDCYDDKELIKAQCKETLAVLGDYVLPKPECVRAVQKSDMACICRIIKSHEELQVCIIKFLRLARAYNRPLPSPGNKCGTYTIPFPPPSKSHL
ncbi:hypothetical protein EJB05_00077 [Eragrostis curvula]|uniref:Bifunctional inhibitor/plant lipid transfer protein/seed storage helical domain-containing protein n=1 Tax=Eragrostis curvula TaxID=38414 RepID=A0A5J9WJC2_9POAL|nr:hypothetical protein EJB05_00077 [Eragrostis curvula]